MDMQKEREAFEAWFASECSISDLSNTAMYSWAWAAWQAAKASANEKIEALQNTVIFADECRKEWHERYMRLRKAKSRAVPDGFVVVPKEPTEKMIDAGHDFCKNNIVTPSGFYKAMIEAAHEQE